MAAFRVRISAKMAAKWRYDMALKDALKKLNTQKSTSRGIPLGMLLKNSENSELISQTIWALTCLLHGVLHW